MIHAGRRAGALACLALALAAAGSGEAQESPAARIAPVVVTARRRAADPFEEPAIVHALEREDLSRQMIRTIPEALWEVPGVMVQKTSHGQGSPFLRGFTGYHTVLLVDGIRLNNSVFRAGPNQYWSTVDPLSIDRLEVVKGPTSVLYGSDAVGGVVQAFTKRREKFDLDIGWDTTTIARVAEAERSIQARQEFEGNYGDVAGFLGGYSFGYFGDVRQGSGEVQDKTGYWQQAGDAKFTIRPDRDTEITAAHYEFDQNDAWRTHATDKAVTFDETTLGTDRVRKFDQSRRLTYARLTLDRGSFYDRFQLTTSLQTQEEFEKRERPDGRITKQGFEVDTPGVGFQFEKEGPVGLVTWGSEWYHDEVDSFREEFRRGRIDRRGLQGPVADNATYDTLGAYVQDEIDLAGDRMTVIGGARFTQTWVDADRIEDPRTGRKLRFHDAWPSLVGSGRVLGRVTDWLHVFTGVNQGFRAPNLSDLSRFDIARSGEQEIPALDLEPEHFLTTDVGAKLRFESFEFQAAYYYTRIWDLILRKPTGRRVGRNLEVTKANSGDGHVQGMELDLAWNFLSEWTLAGDFSMQTSEVEQFPTSAPVLKKDNLDFTPPPMWGARLRYTHPEEIWYAEVASRFALEQDDLSPADLRNTERIPPDGSEGYAVFTIRGGWQATENLKLTAAVENVLDENYRVLGSGSQEPGVNAILGMELRFP